MGIWSPNHAEWVITGRPTSRQTSSAIIIIGLGGSEKVPALTFRVASRISLLPGSDLPSATRTDGSMYIGT